MAQMLLMLVMIVTVLAVMTRSTFAFDASACSASVGSPSQYCTTTTYTACLYCADSRSTLTTYGLTQTDKAYYCYQSYSVTPQTCRTQGTLSVGLYKNKQPGWTSDTYANDSPSNANSLSFELGPSSFVPSYTSYNIVRLFVPANYIGYFRVSPNGGSVGENIKVCYSSSSTGCSDPDYYSDCGYVQAFSVYAGYGIFGTDYSNGYSVRVSSCNSFYVFLYVDNPNILFSYTYSIYFSVFANIRPSGSDCSANLPNTYNGGGGGGGGDDGGDDDGDDGGYSAPLNVGLIVGSVLGGIALLGLLVGAAVLWYRKKPVVVPEDPSYTERLISDTSASAFGNVQDPSVAHDVAPWPSWTEYLLARGLNDMDAQTAGKIFDEMGVTADELLLMDASRLKRLGLTDEVLCAAVLVGIKK